MECDQSADPDPVRLPEVGFAPGTMSILAQLYFLPSNVLTTTRPKFLAVATLRSLMIVRAKCLARLKLGPTVGGSLSFWI